MAVLSKFENTRTIIFFWDFENLALPADYPTHKLIERIMITLAAAKYTGKIKIVAVGNITKMNKIHRAYIRDDIDNVRLVNTEGHKRDKKNVTDVRLISVVGLWGIQVMKDRSYKQLILLLGSGDDDFAFMLQGMKSQGYHILNVQDGNSPTKSLIDIAEMYWGWKTFIGADLPKQEEEPKIISGKPNGRGGSSKKLGNHSGKTKNHNKRGH